MVMEPLQSLRAGELDADANSRPGPVIAIVLEALEDPKMHMLFIGRSSSAVQRSNQDQTRVQLLRLQRDNDSGLPPLFGPVSAPSPHPQSPHSGLEGQTCLATSQWPQRDTRLQGM